MPDLFQVLMTESHHSYPPTSVGMGVCETMGSPLTHTSSPLISHLGKYPQARFTGMLRKLDSWPRGHHPNLTRSSSSRLRHERPFSLLLCLFISHSDDNDNGSYHRVSRFPTPLIPSALFSTTLWIRHCTLQMSEPAVEGLKTRRNHKTERILDSNMDSHHPTAA